MLLLELRPWRERPRPLCSSCALVPLGGATARSATETVCPACAAASKASTSASTMAHAASTSASGQHRKVLTGSVVGLAVLAMVAPWMQWC